MTPKKKKLTSLDKGAGQGADLQNAAPTEGLPTSEQVARRAYELYLERGCGPGQDVNDWLQAEQELRAIHTRETSRSRELA